MDHYEILEVSPSASPEVIKAAYKSLMQRYHPDRNPGNTRAAEHALRVNAAYEVLSDPSKRAAYDIEFKQRRLSNVLGRSKDVLTRSALAAGDGQSYWSLWLLTAAILLAGGFILSLSGKQQAPEPEMRKVGPSIKADRLTHEQARTIPVLIEGLTVNLKAAEKSSEKSGKSSDGTEHVLSIPILGVKVGTFDAEKAISYIERNRELISQELAERLVSAKYEELNRKDGEDYLKRIILDSIGKSTGTNGREDDPPSSTKALGRYGAVDVLLPKSFSVR